MKRLALLLGVCALAACATLPAEGDGNEPASELRGALDIAAVAPLAAEPALPPAPRARAARRGREPTPLQALAAANSAARQRPIADGFIAARVITGVKIHHAAGAKLHR